ncbi:hypothetical protein [Mycobacterium tuberculosis]|uniref:hypothetical protein n=1 Tax=Mycobacterium tuberculosis TaxID=1773 RepID=UPI00272C6424|nr:hypothetical protein [Mycobacterium tuberculosis]
MPDPTEPSLPIPMKWRARGLDARQAERFKFAGTHRRCRLTSLVGVHAAWTPGKPSASSSQARIDVAA